MPVIKLQHVCSVSSEDPVGDTKQALALVNAFSVRSLWGQFPAWD